MNAIRASLLIGALALTGCKAQGPTQVELAIPAAGPAPMVTASRGFDDGLVAGVLTLTPQPTTIGWRYDLDLNEDGVSDHFGTLTEAVDFPYIFENPGLHWLRVLLRGPTGPLDVTIPVAVNDPTAISILAATKLPAATSSFTGITTASDGTVFALHYGEAPWTEFSGRLVEIDPQSLDIRRELAIGSGALNVAVSPSDTLIFITGDSDDFNLVDRNRWRFLWHDVLGNGEQFLYPLDDRRVLTSGETFWFAMVDPIERVVSRHFRPDDMCCGPPTWHFDVSPQGDEVAVLAYGSAASPGPRLFLLDSATLIPRRMSKLPGLSYSEVVAYHPSGDRLYVLGEAEDFSGLRLLVLERSSGRVLKSHFLRHMSDCFGICNFSLLSVTRDGRFVILLVHRDAYFIDTELDLPRFRLALGRGVSASRVEDAVFFLDVDGTVTKVAVPIELH